MDLNLLIHQEDAVDVYQQTLPIPIIREPTTSTHDKFHHFKTSLLHSPQSIVSESDETSSSRFICHVCNKPYQGNRQLKRYNFILTISKTSSEAQ
jgi:hypothetical protein